MINSNTQAILLLTSYFSKIGKDDIKPLSPTEWGRFALWLNEQGNTPEELINGDPQALLRSWSDSKVPLTRIVQLLGRGHALALAMEKWSRAGIWVLTRADSDYPKLLKQHLRTDAPPILFGCGNKRLLNQLAVAVIGSRNANEADLTYTTTLGQKIAHAGLSVVSGGARGVDEAAMLGSLHGEGTAIGVMADSLLQAATASKWRQGLMSNNLVLVSPFYPEAGFSAGNAMARNKYIYCLSQAALVVHSGNKGGTWSGAVENIKKSWVPLWVKKTSDSEAGNASLVNQGGQWVDSDVSSLDIPVLIPSKMRVSNRVDDLLAPKIIYPDESNQYIAAANTVVAIESSEKNGLVEMYESGESTTDFPSAQEVIVHDTSIENTIAYEAPQPVETVPVDLDFYQIFLHKLRSHIDPMSVDDLVELWGLPKILVAAWIKQAVEEGRVKKLSKPVRYQFNAFSQLGFSLD